jgi:5-methylcytosine-specific restriction endonuclease McrA
MRKIINTCTVCKKKYVYSGKGTCSDKCFETKNKSYISWEVRRDSLNEIKDKKKNKGKVPVVKPSIPLPNKKKNQLTKLLIKQSKSWNAHREVAIKKLKGQYAKTNYSPSNRPSYQEYKSNKKILSFYDTKEWQELRYKALRLYGRVCMCCGRASGEMHVDHIKPRSKYPELELIFDNLQILCRDCNMGKSNTDEIDWRPKK